MAVEHSDAGQKYNDYTKNNLRGNLKNAKCAGLTKNVIQRTIEHLTPLLRDYFLPPLTIVEDTLDDNDGNKNSNNITNSKGSRFPYIYSLLSRGWTWMTGDNVKRYETDAQNEQLFKQLAEQSDHDIKDPFELIYQPVKQANFEGTFIANFIILSIL